MPDFGWSRSGLCLGLGFLLLAGCASQPPAPVEGRSAPTQMQTEGNGSTHVVKKGDTLYSIAFTYGLDFRQLAQWNGLSNPNRIFVGQNLRLRADRTPAVRPSQVDDDVKVTAIAEPPRAIEQTAPRNAQKNSIENTAKKSSAVPVTNDSVAKAPATAVDTPRENSENPVNSSEKTQASDLQPMSFSGPVGWSWPADGKIIASYSSAQTGLKGINIGGKTGSPVRVAAAGQVVYAGSGLRGYGQTIIVKHSEEFLSAYAHVSRLHVKENDLVKAGQVIADIGNSGTDAEKLHFQIRYQGQPVDPLKFLPKR